MIYAILDGYKVLAHDYTREGLETTVKTFMPKHEDKEIVEIDDIEVGYDNNTYVKGHAPVPDEELAKQMVKQYRNQLLKSSDEWGVSDRPQTEEVLSHKEWRQYLRDYTETENWWLQNPLTYDEWVNK